MSQIASLVTRAINAIDQASDIKTLEVLHADFLGKKGYFTLQIRALHKLTPKERPVVGLLINKAKKQVQDYIITRKHILKNIELNKRLAVEKIDVSLPGRRIESANLHPVTRTIDRIEFFFCQLGFTVVTGPEIEDDYHNFNALNIPSHHSVRNEHDTFWLDSNRLLRTQTSSVQIRSLKDQKPPIRIIAPGRVYRHDYDSMHTPMFHQMEGLIVDKDINFTNLKGTLNNFITIFFENNLQVRFRASYFPFTEPSAEIDIMDKNGKWIEVLGCGMIHPRVLYNVGIDSKVYSGFAFGMGIERLSMLRYGVSDLRSFFENDLRFLKQFI
ncbi:phenylalanine--tRNA ligase subunit alpha [Candidatus Pantoea carbekii]|uniref:Phenylalanine--tRNA ligase alpha subunit n=1 Tax=Candidatus Pantoea carbekii TaxID=1235990 RepID=U3U840_9GAMM|nr:phenylalanine--tRNA ligase subunit alpha [Candidatus Pantoea carbekii]AKC32106.1 phenylalanyl-tRNA synthetase, alpha subunit [Candidatus Pantoea carbekii]BAO00632.1 phenylalanyl-tRNA synthetase subunit alpha [Candidatus Pantoea carbekii]